MTKLRITLPETPAREYSIAVGGGVLREAGVLLREACPGRRAVVVSDDRVWSLHGEVLTKTLTEVPGGCGVVFDTVIVPAGERSKSLGCLEILFEAFCRFGLRRNDTVIAFGGGVIGDLAGFAAATYMRGVSLVQVPTTLMAQVDSSVGGKVAVNLPWGKNLVGSFYQPRLVVADTSLLRTLDRRDMDSGMAEVVKYAALGDEGLRGMLERPGQGRPGGPMPEGAMPEGPVPEGPMSGTLRDRLTEIVCLSCAAKARLVMEDERDTGIRALLNLGHTFAHAVEAFYGYGTYRHGEAVARGMLLAVETGRRLGVSAPGTFAALKGMLDNAGIDRRLTENVEEGVADFLPLIRGDKKNLSDGGDTASDDVSLVLLRDVGEALVRRVRYEELAQIWGVSI